ncbi:MAG: type IX secretion system sortase PorU [Prevotella sp.]|nr:type IX secretion system sortase PorU [Prevotella sp.]
MREVKTNWRLIAGLTLLLLCLQGKAQEFINLTAQEVRIDSVLPAFTYQKPLGPHYADSIYTVSIEYPEFIDMTETDIQHYLQLADSEPGALPEVTQHVCVARKQGVLDISFCPIVKRDGKYQKLVSFKLNVKGALGARARTRVDESPSARYAEHSVLKSGTWAKIRIPTSGIYQLSSSLVRTCGFSDISKVKIYGYGGALQPEKLTGDYLKATDDLKEVPTCMVGGRKLFYGVGPVTWESDSATTRIRNSYSDYGYYFLTNAGDEEPLTISEDEFKTTYYPMADDYHSLYEVDDYAWFHGGRKLFDKTLYTIGTPLTYTLTSNGTDGILSVTLSYSGYFEATVRVNDQEVGQIVVSKDAVSKAKSTNNPIDFPDDYSKAADHTWTFPLEGIQAGTNTIKITQTSGANVRLDYLALTSLQPKALPDLTSTGIPTPEYVYHITNQDHHADAPVDMVIIIPTTQKWLSEAERIKTLHETKDGLRVGIVPADELYNEFSSGTPDANAYRRYLKMFYDRAETEADMPRYLLLFGDGAWDNRMLLSEWRNCNPDDFLLCYESENSFSEVKCYVSDDYFCLLDDEEQIQEQNRKSLYYYGKPDVAVGRFPARTVDEAKILVDKTVSYANNENAGPWQNILMFMGDDGNNNVHMITADKVATTLQTTYPSLNIKKVYWDAYTRQSSSTGNTYPDVNALIKNQMAEGALMMNYCGHGITYALSHESALHLADFEEATSLRLPLWVTASCDIMPFDGQEENIGESAMMNKKGGAIAFFGTTRTVYANYNELINLGFSQYVLGSTNGVRNSIGEAVRLTKCDLVETRKDITPNKLQYTLLGDPALVLAAPTQNVVIDNINGLPLNEASPVHLPAGSIAKVTGHIANGEVADATFNGTITAYVRDAEETIVCRRNDRSEADEAFVFKDRTKTLYSGSDSIRNGVFTFTFAVPKDISYTDGTGLMTLYAVNHEKTRTAHGENSSFVLNGSSTALNDSIGPSIYCYLNTKSFRNGNKVHTSPYFVAELYDDNGINASGSSIGHDLELIIDGDMTKTYNLNSYFNYEFGDYRSGTLGFSIPKLDYGHHKLLFRAWDVLNNSSTAELDFEVARGIEPDCISVRCVRNSATGGATFIITHDRAGSELNVQLDIYDMAGRQLWRYTESGVPSDNTYTFDWNLSMDGGRRLQTGVYLFKISISSDGSGQSSKTKKLMITNIN